MALTYIEQQKQYTEFLNELDALFRKHNIEHVYATDSTLHFSRSTYDTWTFGSWIMRNDGTRRYTRPGISEYSLNSVDTDSSNTETNTETASTESDTEVLATVEPLVDEPVLTATIAVPKATIIRTDPTGTETLSVTTIKADMQDNTQDNMRNTAVVEDWDTAKQEQVEQEINPKIDEYINDLADRLYKEAKARNFPKNTLGEYWTHPAVVRAVKQSGFNESAYLIISANTTYWHMLAERMKEVEQRDKQQNKPDSVEPTVPVETPIEQAEPVVHMETFSTDTIFGTWTVHYNDYKDSVFIDSGKGRAAIISKVHNWMLIFSRMHPELKNAPTKANISETFTENFDKQQSFRYKWYEFVVDVSYSTPIESENNNNA